MVNSAPFRPNSYTLPEYPQVARMAHIEREVSFTVDVKPDGCVSSGGCFRRKR